MRNYIEVLPFASNLEDLKPGDYFVVDFAIRSVDQSRLELRKLQLDFSESVGSRYVPFSFRWGFRDRPYYYDEGPGAVVRANWTRLDSKRIFRVKNAKWFGWCQFEFREPGFIVSTGSLESASNPDFGLKAITGFQQDLVSYTADVGYRKPIGKWSYIYSTPVEINPEDD